jgi:subtilisin family serine protease
MNMLAALFIFSVSPTGLSPAVDEAPQDRMVIVREVSPETGKPQFTKRRYEDLTSEEKTRSEWENNVGYRATDFGSPPSGPSVGEFDPRVPEQWSLTANLFSSTQLGAPDIDVIRAWNISRGSADVVVYVMDSGIDKRDPDLAGRVTSGFDAYRPNQDPIDENGHGTHVASILAASGGNAYGISGVVPGAIELVDARFLDADNKGDSQAAIRVLQWMYTDMQRRRAANPRVKFVGSNSWGSDQYSAFLERELQRLADFDYLPITSAGNHRRNNDDTPFYPCVLPLLANTCVAASDRNDYLAHFSGYGPNTVHVLAPGREILGILPGQGSGSSYTSRYDRYEGTSQAVPHVAGVAALIWAANPELNALQTRDFLLRGVDRLPGAENEVLSAGRLNAYRSLLLATGQNPHQADRSLTSNQRGGGGGCSLSHSSPHSGVSFGSLLFVILSLWGLWSVRRKPR